MHFTGQDDELYCYICATTIEKQFIEICDCKLFMKYIHLECFQDFLNEVFNERLKRPINTENIDEIVKYINKTMRCNKCHQNIEIINGFKNERENIFSIIFKVAACVLTLLLIFGYEIYKLCYVPFRSFLLLINMEKRVEFLLLYILDSLIRIVCLEEYKTNAIINYIFYLYIGTNKYQYLILFHIVNYFSKYHRTNTAFSTDFNRKENTIKHNIFGLTYNFQTLYTEKGYIFSIIPIYVCLYLLYIFRMILNVYNIWGVYLFMMFSDSIIGYLRFRNKYYSHQISYKFIPEENGELEFSTIYGT